MPAPTASAVRRAALLAYLAGQRRPVRRTDIAAHVPGYSGDPDGAAVKRKLTDDIAELGAVGLRINSSSGRGEADVEQGFYELQRETLLLPDELELTPDELAALKIAARALEQHPELVGVADTPEGASGAVGVQPPAVVTVILDAIDEGRQLASTYSGRPRVDRPVLLAARKGRWYLVVVNVAGGLRRLRIDRMSAAALGEAASPAVALDADAIAHALEEDPLDFTLGPMVTAVLEVPAEHHRIAADLFPTGTWDGDHLSITTENPEHLVAKILMARTRVRLVEGDDVRELLRARLVALA